MLAGQLLAAPGKPTNLQVATGTLHGTTASFVWDKPSSNTSDIKAYHLILNGKDVATSKICNFRFTDLTPSTNYDLVVKAEDQSGALSKSTNKVKFQTGRLGKDLNITDFGAVGDNATLNTKAIQKAIDACLENGTVLIPEGVFISGAIFLKSNMQLKIAKGGVLQGSGNTKDYLPMINNRFEGWEMKTYASLVNAGVMNHDGGFSVENLVISGEGTIRGGGAALGGAMRKENGIRSRGRLILLMNCRNVDLQGLHIENPPCWTIHYLYSQGVSLHDLDIHSNAPNGDGIDPDSSDDSFIFNCSFSTGDDCIAIKSGKNPEGYYIGKPTRGVRITECNFTRGHGISIGSEMSGGVSDVLVRDCKAGPLLHGLQIKGTKDRGGYVRNVRVEDCALQQITIFSAVNYNNDGEPAPVVPVFENYVFKNIDLSTAPVKAPVIDIHGYQQKGHELKNVLFENIVLPLKARVEITDAKNVQFKDLRVAESAAMSFKVDGDRKIQY